MPCKASPNSFTRMTRSRYILAATVEGPDSSTIDFGSFVSPKAIPQMRDTAEVLDRLAWKQSRSALLAIVANPRGAEEASQQEGITYLAFSAVTLGDLQIRNTNKSIAEALNTLEEIQDICQKRGKKLVTYISMGFGNPYGDPYHTDLVGQFVDILVTLGSSVVSLADTVGTADAAQIRSLFETLTRQYPPLSWGASPFRIPWRRSPRSRLLSRPDAGASMERSVVLADARWQTTTWSETFPRNDPGVSRIERRGDSP